MGLAQTLGQRIERRRKIIRLRAKDLASMIGVGETVIYKTECGVNPLTIERLIQITDALQWHYSDLLEGF